MKYILEKDCIKVYSKEEFNPQHILECGQVFCFQKEGGKYIVFPGEEYAEIIEEKSFYIIKTKNPCYFEKWFDLKNDYGEIKQALSTNSIMQNPLDFGGGIRILKQDLFETLISFIISANNNIKRIALILNNLRKTLGRQMNEGVYSFPSQYNLHDIPHPYF